MSDQFNPVIGHAEAPQNIWVIIFLDMLSLLLAFFILLFATSTPKKDKLHAVTGPMMERYNSGQPVELSASSLDILSIQPEIALNLDYLSNLFKEQTKLDPLLDQALIARRGDSLVISLPSELIFESAQASLKAEAKKALGTLAFMLMNIDNRIEIRGHSDPAQIHGGVFTSNWELSLARARSVVNVLREFDYDRPVIARGLADSHFSDIEQNLEETEKFALGRRVDIVIYPSGVK